jgi:DNA-binding PadR family transcriptional regulator
MSIGTTAGTLRGMSLRHALLGLLAEGPASGFDLTKTFDQQLGRWAWHTTHSHIYPELHKMAADGLIDVTETGSRGRKTYAITDAGLSELRRWMLSEPTRRGTRNESALRLFLIGVLDPDDAKRILQDYADQAAALLADIEAVIAAAPDAWRDNPLSIGRLAAERGRHTLPALQDWTRWAMEQIDQTDGPAATAGPTRTDPDGQRPSDADGRPAAQ